MSKLLYTHKLEKDMYCSCIMHHVSGLSTVLSSVLLCSLSTFNFYTKSIFKGKKDHYIGSPMPLFHITLLNHCR